MDIELLESRHGLPRTADSKTEELMSAIANAPIGVKISHAV
jgi:hypothetical protein